MQISEKGLYEEYNESQGRENLLGCHLWGHTESDTTEAIQQQVNYDINRNYITSKHELMLSDICYPDAKMTKHGGRTIMYSGHRRPLKGDGTGAAS